MAPMIAKSASSQTTSSVNGIATRGSSNMSAAITQGAILQKRPRRPPPFSAFPAIALLACMCEVFNLASQLRSASDVSVSCGGLVSAAPERPSDDVSRPDAALSQPRRHAPDLLDRPADQVVA